MPQGVGGFVYLSDQNENVSQVSEAGRAYFSDSYARIKNHSPINVNNGSGGSGFESAPVGKMYVRSESGNGIMWIGGTGEDAPYSGHGFPLWGGETSPILYVNDFSSVRVCSSVSGQIVYAIGFLNGEDVTLSQTSPELPDVIAPILLSHSPVSGLSGVARNSEVTALFSERINSLSVTSGSFKLSPAHDVTVFRDTTDVTKIVMSPNALFSGSTVYTVEINTNITDRVGNRLSGVTIWPFTTVAGPPPPDTTPPVVSGTNPTSGASDVAVTSNITITFSEQMLSGTINTTNIFIVPASGGANVDSVVTLDASDKKTATIDPVSDLDQGTMYYINATSGCQDIANTPAAGNPLTPVLSGRPFTTGYTYSFQEVYNVTGTTDTNPLYNGSDTRCGVAITGSCALKGASVFPKRVVVSLKKVGSPTGTAYVRMRRSSNDSIGCEFGSIDVSTLTTDFVEYTFTNINNTVPTDTNDDKILVEYNGGNASNYVSVKRNASDVYAGAEFVQYESTNVYSTLGSRDVCFRIYK